MCKQHVKQCEFWILVEIQKVEKECTVLRDQRLQKSCYIKTGSVVLVLLQGYFLGKISQK